ncbi:MAG: flagellar biosynthetic protein FliO [Veillonellaceae bacterium]|uniref:FliO/MopB family protein n=1 Tax=uncultured Selenomonas sp. TaxID=159275 RepID=UPI0025E9EE85|nr:flagellar biosynthetic protein FliO [uncultured Selenomonas sp.]MCI7541360.1 flagellar biosynthetic protein FliO [Veillonellaceae bacterium]
MNRKIMWMQVTALAVICVFILQDSAWAADAASSSGYLSGYENPDPRPSPVSWWSTLAYLLSLLVIFGFVVVMAYFVARFVGGHFGKSVSRHGGRLLVSLPLGPKSSAAVVEIAGRTFLLGVTESNVSMLAEITDPREIEALERESALLPQQAEGTMFTSQLGALADFVSRFRKS